MRSVFLGTLNWYKTKFFFFFFGGSRDGGGQNKGTPFFGTNSFSLENNTLYCYYTVIYVYYFK